MFQIESDEINPSTPLAHLEHQGVPGAQAVNKLPVRPQADVKTMQWLEAWWQTTEDLPHHDIATRAHEVCQQTLHPAWYDDKDPFKGRTLANQRTREKDRLVRTPLAYLNNRQNVAQAIPESHDVKWKPDELANSEQIGPDPELKKFANSQRSVTKKYVRDAAGQDVLEEVIADAYDFPMGVLKVHFERDLVNEPLKKGIESDGQDNLARIKQLSEDLARGVITKDDPQCVELADLLNGLGQSAEIEVREGLVIQNLDMRRVRFPKCNSLSEIYLSPWISHDEDQTKRKLRAAYPFKVTETDAAGNATKWEGIHPEDLDAATPCAGGVSRKTHLSDRFGERKGSSGEKKQKDDETELMTREIWDRESGYVYVIVEGIPYAVAKYKPTKVPNQWYPFVFLVLNRVFGQVTGIADTELQADTQARIHRKQSDEEYARWQSLPRGFIDSSMMDPTQQKELVKSEPFSWKPLQLGGKGIDAMMKVFQWAFNPIWFSREDDKQDLQRQSSLPEQALGATGSANFAKEVEVAAAGNSVSNNFRNNRSRRFLERFYSICNEILLQELDTEAALAVDHTVTWPHFYSDQEAQAAYDTIAKEVNAQVMQEVIADTVPRDPLTGMVNPAAINPHEIKRLTSERSAPIIEQRCLAEFGTPRPLSRESMSKLLCCKVTVVQDGELDKQKRLLNLSKSIESLGIMMKAGAEAGITVNWRPLLKAIAELSGADEDMAEEMFTLDADGAMKALAEAVTQGAQLSPESLQIAQALAPAIAQQTQQAAAPTQDQTQPQAQAAPQQAIAA